MKDVKNVKKEKEQKCGPPLIILSNKTNWWQGVSKEFCVNYPIGDDGVHNWVVLFLRNKIFQVVEETKLMYNKIIE